MQATIVNSEQCSKNFYLSTLKTEEKKPENAKDTEFQENFQINDQSEFAYSCMSLPSERKASYDSMSVSASQAETMSQTSESSFFLSYKNANSHTLTSNEVAQAEKNQGKNIPFFHGVKEYYQKLMPEKFTEYTKTKNYMHKSIYLNKFNRTDSFYKNKREENIPLMNYYYFPMIYYPFNSFFFNHFPNVIINNNFNNNRIKLENIKEIIQKKIEVKKEEVKETENKKEEDKKPEDKKLEDKKSEEDEIQKDEKDEEKKEVKFEEEGENHNLNTNIRHIKYNKQYNYKREQYNHYKKSHYNNQRYFNNRQYNRYTYYNDKDTFQGERNNYYYNNYYKRRYQKPFENKFYSYK